MKKVQILEIDYSPENGQTPPLYHPFTGEKLLEEDTLKEQDLSHTDSVMLLYVRDYLAEGPEEIHPDFKDIFDELQMDAIDGEDELIEKLEQIRDEYLYIVILIGLYGVLPGDYGGYIYVIRQNQVFLPVNDSNDI